MKTTRFKRYLNAILTRFNATISRFNAGEASGLGVDQREPPFQGPGGDPEGVQGRGGGGEPELPGTTYEFHDIVIH